MQRRAEQIQAQLEEQRFEIEDDGYRSPSPPPVYNEMGQRVNTREVREKVPFLVAFPIWSHATLNVAAAAFFQV